jgi:hypothetical protein
MKKLFYVVAAIAVGMGAAFVLGILGSTAVPGLQKAWQEGNMASAIASMRAIISAQVIYAATCGSGFYSPNLVNLGVPPAGSPVGFMSPDLAATETITKSGYVLTMGSSSGPAVDAPASCNGLPAGTMAGGFYVTATPESAEMGTRAFAANTDAIVWFAEQQTPIRVTNTGQPQGTLDVK